MSFQPLFLSFFSGRGGITKGKIFFFDFLPFQAILSRFWIFPIFCKIDLIGGGGAGGGQKILACDFTKIDAFWVCSGMAVLNSALLKTLPIPCPRVMVPRVIAPTLAAIQSTRVQFPSDRHQANNLDKLRTVADPGLRPKYWKPQTLEFKKW